MQARFFCPTGDLAGADFQIGEQAEIGRDAANQITVTAGEVGGRHARISFDPKLQCYFLEPLEDNGKTWLDGAKVSRKVRLAKLHVITLGNGHEFVFHQLDRAPQPKAEQTDVSVPKGIELPELETPAGPIAEAPPKTAPTASETIMAKQDGLQIPSFQQSEPTKPSPSETMASIPKNVAVPSFDDQAAPSEAASPAKAPTQRLFFLINLDGETIQHPLEEGEYAVGRGKDCEIRVENSSLSRRHALLKVDSGRVWIEDLGSVNHTFLDGEQIRGKTELTPGKMVRFGLIEAELISSA